MAFDLPLLLRVELVVAGRFSLSEEKDAAGEGDSEAMFDTRPCPRRVVVASEYVSVSSFLSAGEDNRARRAMVVVDGLRRCDG